MVFRQSERNRKWRGMRRRDSHQQHLVLFFPQSSRVCRQAVSACVSGRGCVHVCPGVKTQGCPSPDIIKVLLLPDLRGPSSLFVSISFFSFQFSLFPLSQTQSLPYRLNHDGWSYSALAFRKRRII